MTALLHSEQNYVLYVVKTLCSQRKLGK